MSPVEQYLADVATLVAAAKRQISRLAGKPVPTPAPTRLSAPMIQITWATPVFTRVGSDIEVTGPATLKNSDEDGNLQSTQSSDLCRVIVKFDSEPHSIDAMDFIVSSGEVAAHVVLYNGTFDDFFMTTADGKTLRAQGYEI